MTNEMASIIVGNIPINGDECYTIPEYQQAKAMAIKALELKAKMEQDYEALKNKIPKGNLTESYQYCFLTEYLEVQDEK